MWKLPTNKKFTLNDIIERFGAPGGWFIIQESISSGVKSILPWRSLVRYQIKTALYAFSLEQEPHIMVDIWFKPLGATDNNILFNFSGQSFEGNTPSAGRFINAF